MNIKKLIASFAAAAVSVAVMAVSACAYDIDKDFKTTWSVNTTIPGSEFESITTDSVITFTYTADASLAEKEGHNYWVIKPMFNDSGWPLIDDLIGIDLSEGKDTYLVDPDKSQVSFSIPEETLEKLKVCGMALMGHGVKLETMTVSNDKSLADVLAATPNYSPADEEAAPAVEDAQDPDDAPPVELDEDDASEPEPSPAPASDSVTTSTTTGNTGAVVFVGAMAMAMAAAFASRKK